MNIESYKKSIFITVLPLYDRREGDTIINITSKILKDKKMITSKTIISKNHATRKLVKTKGRGLRHPRRTLLTPGGCDPSPPAHVDLQFARNLLF